MSPSLSFSSFTTPAAEDGISIDALSLSTVISDCSALIRSPGLTSSSITATSLKSPMSGTFTSSSAIVFLPHSVSFSVCTRTGSAEFLSNSQPARTPISATSLADFRRP